MLSMDYVFGAVDAARIHTLRNRPCKTQSSFTKPRRRPHNSSLLFHGVGLRAEDLQPLGQAWGDTLRMHASSAYAPDAPPDLWARAGEWFSVRGVDEANRPTRVADAMPPSCRPQHWQGEERDWTPLPRR